MSTWVDFEIPWVWYSNLPRRVFLWAPCQCPDLFNYAQRPCGLQPFGLQGTGRDARA